MTDLSWVDEPVAVETHHPVGSPTLSLVHVVPSVDSTVTVAVRTDWRICRTSSHWLQVVQTATSRGKISEQQGSIAHGGTFTGKSPVKAR